MWSPAINKSGVRHSRERPQGLSAPLSARRTDVVDCHSAYTSPQVLVLLLVRAACHNTVKCGAASWSASQSGSALETTRGGAGCDITHCTKDRTSMDALKLGTILCLRGNVAHSKPGVIPRPVTQRGASINSHIAQPDHGYSSVSESVSMPRTSGGSFNTTCTPSTCSISCTR